VFSGLAATTGVEPTVGMQLHPGAMHRIQQELFDPKETTIDFLASRRSIWFANDEVPPYIQWDANHAEGTPLLSFPLNSILFDTLASAFDITSEKTMATSTAILNMFRFFRADLSSKSS
jgi:hypothetical protein